MLMRNIIFVVVTLALVPAAFAADLCHKSKNFQPEGEFCRDLRTKNIWSRPHGHIVNAAKAKIHCGGLPRLQDNLRWEVPEAQHLSDLALSKPEDAFISTNLDDYFLSSTLTVSDGEKAHVLVHLLSGEKLVLPPPVESDFLCVATDRSPDSPYANEKKQIQVKDATFVFELINSGKFTMGSSTAEQLASKVELQWYEISDDEQEHEVEITRDFFILNTEVTQKQWVAVMGEIPLVLPHRCALVRGPDLPMACISRDDAQRFLAALSKEKSMSFGLPTEAEWEYSARCGTKGPYSTDKVTKENLLEKRIAWFNKNSKEMTPNPVAQMNANPCGLYDVHGNVAEWVLDLYGAYDSSMKKDPVIDVSQHPHHKGVIRGGSVNDSALGLRSANRTMHSPFSDRPDETPAVGFRPVIRL